MAGNLRLHQKIVQSLVHRFFNFRAVFLRALIPLSFLASILTRSEGQILDDSTQQVYGPTTSMFIYESNVRENRGTYQVIDTTLDNAHRFDPVNINDNKYQYLGVLGTAMSPIFYRTPDRVGVDHGFHSYDPYFKDYTQFKYYDTKSPFMDLSVYLGGGRRSLVSWEVSQNITPNLNVGFDIYSIVADRQFGANASRGDRNATSLSYDLYTHYKTNDSSYQVMANFSRMRHQVWETGGIVAFDTGSQEEFFEELYDEDADVWLRDVLSGDLRQNYHLYHQYDLGSLLQVYHAVDWNKQWNTFATDDVQEHEFYWDDILFNEDSTKDRTSYREFTNQLGIKGDFRGFLYDFHYKRRKVRFVPRYLPTIGPVVENFAGGRLGYQLNPDIFIEADAEFIVLVQNYRIKAKAKYRWIDLEVGRSQYKPSFIHQSYFGNHIEWRRFPISPVDDFVRLGAALNLGAHYLRPYIDFTQVTNPIFFDLDKRPNQASGAAQIASVGLISQLNFIKVLNFDSEIKFTNVSGVASRVFQIPQLYFNGKFYFEDQVFLKRLWMQFGLDLHWKSTYMANSYDPITQQFYLQDQFEIPSFLLMDVFFNFRIGNALLFVKLINMMEGMLAQGYLSTPFYRGTNRNVDLGLKWFFFD